jgi:hypothetical protein
MPIRGNSIGVITGQNDRYFEAVGLMDTIKDELNQAAEGHSHYFLNEPLTILQDPAFPVQSDELRRILDLAAAALSVGPRANKLQTMFGVYSDQVTGSSCHTHHGSYFKGLRPNEEYWSLGKLSPSPAARHLQKIEQPP